MDGYGDQNRKGVRGRNCNQRVTEESVESQTASFASSSPSSFLGLDPRGVLTVVGLNAAVTLPTYTTTNKEFCITCHHQQRESSFWNNRICIPRSTVRNVTQQAMP